MIPYTIPASSLEPLQAWLTWWGIPHRPRSGGIYQVAVDLCWRDMFLDGDVYRVTHRLVPTIRKFKNRRKR